MKILVINAGSSSLKFQLIDMNGEVVIAKGTCGRVGAEYASGARERWFCYEDRQYGSYT